MIHKYVVRDKKKALSLASMNTVIVHPVVTEKSMVLSEKGRYTFVVASWANKIMISQAIERIFGVKVKAVNTLNVRARACHFRGRKGVRGGWKKAVVALKDGFTIDMGSGAQEGQ